MDSAIAALSGAFIGALSGIISVVLTTRLQDRVEHRRWVRDKKSQAYSEALKFLYKLSNKCSLILSNEKTIMTQEHQKVWLDDYIDTIQSLSTLAIFASEEFDENVLGLAIKLRQEFESVITVQQKSQTEVLNVTKLMSLTESLEDELVNAAIRDLGLKSSNLRNSIFVKS